MEIHWKSNLNLNEILIKKLFEIWLKFNRNLTEIQCKSIGNQVHISIFNEVPLEITINSIELLMKYKWKFQRNTN